MAGLWADAGWQPKPRKSGTKQPTLGFETATTDRLTKFLRLTPSLPGPKVVNHLDRRNLGHPISEFKQLKSETSTAQVNMAGEPGEAMAHSAFDTILVLDFG